MKKDYPAAGWKSKLVLVSTASFMAIGLGASAFAAQAQDKAATGDAASDSTVVVVTGIRGSLQKAMNIKKKSLGIVDAISSEDIGKFPDSNLAASVQRIPGVSISRTSTGKASQVTIRGFGPSFNETLIDGRQASSGQGNRSFDFSGVGADFVGEVDVLKTPDSSLSSGAIGATINIKYPKPMDRPGFHVAATLSGNRNDKDGNTSAGGGFLISDTFADDKFGVLFDVTSSRQQTETNHVQNQGWGGFLVAPSQLKGAAAGASTTGTTPAWFSQDYGVFQEHTDDKRMDGRLVLQWRPNEDWLITLNDNHSRTWSTGHQYGYAIWFNSGSLQNVTQSPNGTITNFSQANSPTDIDSNTTYSHYDNNDLGLNIKWTVNDKLHLEFDADNGDSKRNPNGELDGIGGDIGYGGPLTNNTGLAGIGANQVPYTTEYGPGNDHSRFGDPAILGSHVVVITSQHNHDVVNQTKFMGSWDEDNLHLKAGVQYLDETQDLSNVGNFANGNWQAYAGYGPASNNNNGVMIPAKYITGSFSTSNFIRGFSGNGNLPANIPVYDGLGVFNYLQSLDPACANGCDPHVNGPFMIALDPASVQKVEEKTLAAFLSLNTTVQLADRPMEVNIGIREEDTHVISNGIGQLPVSMSIQPNDHTAFNIVYTPTQPLSQKNQYRYMLPNLDLSYALTDTLKLRFDASRTLSRPGLSSMTPDLNVGQGQRVNALTGSGGNPKLLPYLSDNLDFGAEWYYGSNSYAAIDVFSKDVTNFIVTNTVTQSINGVIDPTTNKLAQFAYSTSVNGPSANVHGVELAWQHVFADTGFGFQANATFVGTDKPYDPNDISTSGFAVTGLANSANAVVFYDKRGFQARIAVNWRDEYLDHFGQTQNVSQFGTEPTFVNSSTNVDFSTSYDITRNLSVFLEGLNLTNQTLTTHGRYKDQILDLYDYGQRWTMGVRYHY
ncbi:TonB-dependent receptor [Asticcacaulis sp. EMRT-3]|uniref:TonB-dependent receptor n=1 Tax=Asticcacaulis sp. EMRT-3 TaxID=3040349 RepID=UPI0024AF54EF|nr:TonB-dependent receptor [Asticcacaulis sp. EMRT-3]MDI7774950.1 TonB-dependent receptor [Asticcacaulis sp. EMRT-3]